MLKNNAPRNICLETLVIFHSFDFHIFKQTERVLLDVFSRVVYNPRNC